MSEAFKKYTEYKNEDKSDKALKWFQTNLKETAKTGYKVSAQTRPIVGTKMTLIAYDIVYEGAELEKVVASFTDHFALDTDLKEYKLIEKKENSAVHYCRYAIPIPFVSDRDVVTEISTEEVEGGTFVLTTDVEHADYPADPKLYRMTFWSGALLQQEGSNVRCTSFEYADAGHKFLNGFDASMTCGEIELIIKTMEKNAK